MWEGLPKKSTQLCGSLGVMLALTMPAWGDITIASWNVKHSGWGKHKDYALVGHIGSTFDLLAIQEIMSEEGADAIHDALEAESGEQWDYLLSHLIGRGSYREAYGFYWRESAVKYADGAVVFLDASDVFAREPMSARFRSLRTGTEFALANIHVLYGDSVQDRLPEIHALEDYWGWLGEVYPDTPRLLVGDFNLESDHPAFQPLEALGVVPAVVDGHGTTISTIEGRYANHYDHIFVEEGALPIGSRGIMRFPDQLGMTNTSARETVSDHVPVWIGLGDASAPSLTPLDAGAVLPTSAANDPTYDCIDLNQGNAEELDRLPHIGEARAQDIIAGRPWPSAQSLTAIRGLGESRVGDILASELLCRY